MPDHSGDASVAGDMMDSLHLFAIKPERIFRIGGFYGSDSRRNFRVGDAGALAPGQNFRRLRHVVFGAQDIACGEDRRLGHLAGLQVRLLRLQQYEIIRGHQLGAYIGEIGRIVDIAVQSLGDVTFVEGGALVAELFQE